MSSHEFFDVLNISDENANVDMIQVLMGNDCLGTYFKNGNWYSRAPLAAGFGIPFFIYH